MLGEVIPLTVIKVPHFLRSSITRQQKILVVTPALVDGNQALLRNGACIKDYAF